MGDIRPPIRPSICLSVTPRRITDAGVPSPERGNGAGVKDFILHQATGKSRENGRKGKEASNYQRSPIEGTQDQPGVRKDKRKKQAAMRTEDDPQTGEGQGEGSACRINLVVPVSTSTGAVQSLPLHVS
ncbi:hypothetical protein INR49_014010 [Caranx melampygus]|nr:hypothetical protein INR49_014010 [Caranx melampygus]